MRVAARLLDENHLIDAGVLILPQSVNQLRGRADAVADRGRHRVAPTLEPLPHIRHARDVLAIDVVVAEREAEELEAVAATPDRLRLVMVHRKAGRHRDVGVHRMADRHAFIGLDDLVVFAGPFRGLDGIDESERERADTVARGDVDRLLVRAGEPDRRVRLLQRLRNDVAGRHREEVALEAGIRRHRHHVGALLRRLGPHQLFLRRIDVETFQFSTGRRGSGAPFGTAGGDEVEHGNPFRHMRGRIIARRREHHPVADMDLPRAPGGGGEEHLGRGVV